MGVARGLWARGRMTCGCKDLVEVTLLVEVEVVVVVVFVVVAGGRG